MDLIYEQITGSRRLYAVEWHSSVRCWCLVTSPFKLNQFGTTMAQRFLSPTSNPPVAHTYTHTAMSVCICMRALCKGWNQALQINLDNTSYRNRPQISSRPASVSGYKRVMTNIAQRCTTTHNTFMHNGSHIHMFIFLLIIVNITWRENFKSN